MPIRLLLVIAAMAMFAAHVHGADGDGSAGSTEAYFNCVPMDVAVFDNRAHVLCSEPIIKYRGGYPTDNGDTIKYFAVPRTDTFFYNGFVHVANTALASGTTIKFSYTSGDHSGDAFGCMHTDCRQPWAFTLMSTAHSP